ncbi:MAG: hypothetical protein ACTH1D_04545 [Mycobacteriaceae bacterium]
MSNNDWGSNGWGNRGGQPQQPQQSQPPQQPPHPQYPNPYQAYGADQGQYPYPGQQPPPGYPGGGYGQGPEQQAQQKSNRGVVVTIVVALVALIGAGTAGLWFLNRDSGDDADGGSIAFAPSETESDDDSLGADLELDTDSDVGSGEGFEDRLLDDDGEGAEESDMPPGLGYSGYEDYDNASCDGGDTWVYAGEGDGSAVVVCMYEDSGDLYMRADFASGTVDGDVDMDRWVDVEQGAYSVDVDGGVIELLGPDIWFSGDDDNEDLAVFDNFWYDDTVWQE